MNNKGGRKEQAPGTLRIGINKLVAKIRNLEGGSKHGTASPAGECRRHSPARRLCARADQARHGKPRSRRRASSLAAMLNSDMLFRVYCIVVGVRGDYSAPLRRAGGVLLTNPLLSKQRAVYRRDSRLGVLCWCLCRRPANNKGGRVGGMCMRLPSLKRGKRAGPSLLP